MQNYGITLIGNRKFKHEPTDLKYCISRDICIIFSTNQHGLKEYSRTVILQFYTSSFVVRQEQFRFVFILIVVHIFVWSISLVHIKVSNWKRKGMNSGNGHLLQFIIRYAFPSLFPTVVSFKNIKGLRRFCYTDVRRTKLGGKINMGPCSYCLKSLT